MTIPVPGPDQTFAGMLPMADTLAERHYVSQYAIEDISLGIYVSGVPESPTGGVNVTMWSVDDSTIRGSWSATKEEAGKFTITLQSAHTSAPGPYLLEWKYLVGADEQSFVGYVEVGEASPTYDALSDGFKNVVESALIRFADLFDSPHGGPHLSVYYQSRFGRERVAQLLRIALGRLNTVSQPRTIYTIEPGGKEFPFGAWGPLLEQALYVECIKHLIRSYVEQPDAVGVVVSRLDRRDYMNRWQTVLQMEQKDLEDQMDNFKISHMGLGSPSVLVAGGAYRHVTPRGIHNAGRPRMWSRFY